MRALGWSNASLVDGSADGLRQTPVDGGHRGPMTPPGALSRTAQHRHDAGIALALALLAHIDSGASCAREITTQPRCGEKNDRFNVRQALPMQGLLVLQQRFQLLGFAIGE